MDKIFGKKKNRAKFGRTKKFDICSCVTCVIFGGFCQEFTSTGVGDRVVTGDGGVGG